MITAIHKFPDFSEIKLEQKSVFNGYFSNLNPRISEFCFGYLFSWRIPLKLSVTLLNDNLCVCGFIDNSPFFFQPIGTNNIEETGVECLRFLKDKYGSGGIISAAEEFSMKIAERYRGRLKISEERNYFDYVYKTEDLTMLKGERYQSKRNFINRFKKNYNFEYKKFNVQTRQMCLDFQKNWCDMKSCSGTTSLIDENIATVELLKNFDELDLCGYAIVVGGDVIAFSVGERLNKDTFAIHIEKANTKYQGSYQIMNQITAQEIKSMGYEFINREEDLGQSNLRKSKKSYYPMCLIRKFRIVIL